MGRPSKYTDELAQNFCIEIMDGKSVREICKSSKYPSRVTIFSWLNKNDDFLNLYEKAKAIQADVMAEDILTIADDASGEVPRDRLRIDARKWLLSKLMPKKYGHATQIEHKTVTQIKPIDYGSLSDAELDLIIAQGEAENNQVTANRIKNISTTQLHETLKGGLNGQ